MQWSPDRNAGFSQSNPHRLFLPTIVEPEYHYQSRNVETEEQSPHSFLWWLRRVLRVRRRYAAFSRGELSLLQPQNPRILAFVRQFEEEVILVVVNLSRLSQFVELDLSRYRGRIPIEIFGQTRFPMIGELPYLLSLGPHGFYWFRLDWPHGEEVRREPEDLPTVHVREKAFEAFERPLVEATIDALAAYLPRQSWYLSPERIIRSIDLVDMAAMTEADDDGTRYLTVLARVHYTEGESATYQLTLMLTGEHRAQQVLHDRPTAGVLRILTASSKVTWYVCDSTFEREVWDGYVKYLMESSNVPTSRGSILWTPIGGVISAPRESTGVTTWQLDSVPGAVTASNRQVFVKLNRRVESGRDPEVELGMSQAAHLETFPSPHLRGVWEYRNAKDGTYTLGTVYQYVSHERPLLDFCRDDLRRALENALAQKPFVEEPSGTSDGSFATPFSTVRRWFALLGRRLADAHASLANARSDPGFAPEPFSLHYRQSLFFGYRAQAQQALELLSGVIPRVHDAARREWLQAAYDRLQSFGRVFRILVESRAPLVRIRIHDNLTMDQVLLLGEDLRIVGWESDPRRSYGSRRIKQSVLVELARIVDSLHHTARSVVASHSADQTGLSQEATDRIAATTRAWLEACDTSLRDGYYQSISRQDFVPENANEFQGLLKAFRLDIAFEVLLETVETKNDDAIDSAVSGCVEILE